ncbi:hypothetical protein [Stenotrophomonas sp.]|uniref:hypothetical protein n=1 Tax=Stenotrophomonas sp. TaxID=69392 RepID=UPI00289CED89|nr:hypothetical protein [Stenotrophomonas sp.]
MRFEIIGISPGKRKPYFVFVQKLDNDPFVFPKNAMLGGVPVSGLLGSPRSVTREGVPIPNIYTFGLHKAGAQLLKAGQILELTGEMPAVE